MFLSSISKGQKSTAPCNAVSKACISHELRVYAMGLLHKAYVYIRRRHGGQVTWCLSHRTGDVCGLIRRKQRCVKLGSSSRRALSDYLLPRPLDFFGCLSVIRQITVMHLRLCLVPVALHTFVCA